MITYESVIDYLSEYGDVRESETITGFEKTVNVSLEKFKELITSFVEVLFCTKDTNVGLYDNSETVSTFDDLKTKQSVQLYNIYDCADLLINIDFCKNLLIEKLSLSDTTSSCEISKVKIPINQIPSENILNGSLYLYGIGSDGHLSGNCVCVLYTPT